MAISTILSTPTSRAGPLYRALLVAVPVLLGAVVFIGAYAFLPPLLEHFVARDLQEGLGLEEAPEVDVTSGPAPNALLGKFEEGKVTLEGTDLGGVRPDEVTVYLEPFDLDLLGSVASGRVRSEESLSGFLWAELSEEEVARIIRSSNVTEVLITGVRIGEGYLVVASEVGVLGTRIPFSVGGELFLRNSELVFEPRQLEALGEPVPDRLARELLGGTDFAYPIDELPFEGEFSGLELHEGGLVLTGQVEDLPVQ